MSRSFALNRSRRAGGWPSLLAASSLVAAIWMVLLPRVGAHPAIRSSIDRRTALGVNAEALFYTDLEAMESLVVHWDRSHGGPGRR
jgi:hypothetical protein